MARDLTAGVATEIASAGPRPVLFYEGEFEDGLGGTQFLRLWSGVGDFTWDAKTWTGAGKLLGFSVVEETSDLRASSFTVSLAGDSDALLAINLGLARQGLPGTVWKGYVDAAGAVIVDPYNTFTGRLDVPDIVDEGERCTLGAVYESRLIDAERPRLRRYTDQDQKIDYATDEGFGLVPKLQQMDLTWGRR